MSEQRLEALQQYLTSLTPYNPAWHLTKDRQDGNSQQQQEEEQHDSFSGRLQLEYNSNRRVEVQRRLGALGDGGSAGCGSPVTLEVSSECGRYLVASRNITAGQELFRETPLVVTPRPTPDTACLACLHPLHPDWQGCEDCGAPLCWPHCPGKLHTKEECQSLAGLDLNLNTTSRLQELNEMLTPLRTLQVLEATPRLQGVVAAMQSNTGQRRRLGLGQAAAGRIAVALGEDTDVVSHILGSFDTNAFTVTYSESEGGGMGRALLPLAALMNHSCTPNTQHWFHSGVLIVRAVCDIPMGTEVTNSYTPTLWGTSARAVHLAASKLFRCNCPRCTDPTELGSHLSSLACRACCNGLLVPPVNPKAAWTCRRCGATVGRGAVEAMVRGAAGTVRRVGEEDVEGLGQAVAHFTRVLGHTHYVTREATHALLLASLNPPLAAVSESDLERAVVIARHLLAVADLVDPGLSRFRGVLLLELARASTELLRRRLIHSVPCLITINDHTDTEITSTSTSPDANSVTMPPTNTKTKISTLTDTNAVSVSPTSTRNPSNTTTVTNTITSLSTYSNNMIKENVQNTADSVAEDDASNRQHKYNLDTVEAAHLNDVFQELLAAAEESEVILKFDSRLPDVIMLKQQLLELQHK